ncbi:MAG TPA: helix-turn-helix transcriptional regulator [Chloroflexota bacterium]|nr:helix-turn-helix transcriptional regulator [Chloroflexota bacterium]
MNHTTDQEARRRELADFLRTRRARLRPEEVGLANGGRRRTPGLRREELAQLAGVGITWYTWLEQARPIRVSAQVLESLARTLGLSVEERTHLFDLAHGEGEVVSPPEEVVNPAIRRVLDQQEPCPAYVLGRRWDLLAWNAAATRVFADFVGLPEGFRNIVWYMFTDAGLRRMLVDWERQAQRQLAQFRASSARHAGDPAFTQFVEALRAHSPEFRQWWARHDVLGRPEARKDLDHPLVGRLALEQTTFHADTNPELRLVLYTPLAEESTTAKLLQLAHSGKEGDR